MAYLDDYGNSMELDSSASPGLPTLPAEGRSPSIGLADQMGPPQEPMGPPAPAPVTDLSSMASVSPGLNKPATSGLGLANYKSARSDDDMEYLKNLPTAQKIGLVLQSFGAGVNGQANPIDTLLANKQKREAEFRNELGTTLNTIKTGMALVKGVSDPKAKAALIEQLKRAAGGGDTANIIGDALSAAGTGDEQAVTNILSVITEPSARAALVKAAMQSDIPRKEAARLLTDKDAMDRFERLADQNTLPSATAKMAIISRAFSKDPKYKTDDGASFTMSDLRDQNNNLPASLRLTDTELGTITRNQATFSPYGLQTDKTLQDQQSAVAKRKEEGPLSDVAKLKADLDANRITQRQYDLAMKQKENKVVIQNNTIAQGNQKVAAGANAELTPEAIKAAAGRYRIDGTLPANLGRGTQGPANTVKIMNQAAAAADAEGETGEATRIRQLATKATQKALSNTINVAAGIERSGAILDRHFDVLTGLAKQMDPGRIQALNKAIIAGEQQFNDPLANKYAAQMQQVMLEYGKLKAGPNSSAMLPVEAIKLGQQALSTGLDVPSLDGIHQVVKQDIRINKEEANRTADGLRQSMGTAPKAPNSTAPAASTAGALPLPKTQAELVAGKKYQTARGVATWDGAKFVQ